MSIKTMAKVMYGKNKICNGICTPMIKTNKNIGKVISIINYDKSFGKKDGEEYELFIFLPGMRKENYSNNGIADLVGVSGWGISNFLTILDETEQTKYKAITILQDNDMPLEKQSQMIAKKVEEFKAKEECKKIHILGVSKCGCMNIAILKYLTENNLDKLNIMSFEAPYLGTIFASPLDFFYRVDEIIKSIPFDMKESLKDLADLIKLIYWNHISKSHMDFDIAGNCGNGIPKKYVEKYDNAFLDNLFTDEKTFKILEKVKFTNITTFCSSKTLKRGIETGNISLGLLFLSDKMFFDEVSDGMVTLRSSSYIENVCKERKIKINKMCLYNGHHDLAGDIKLCKLVVNSLIF